MEKVYRWTTPEDAVADEVRYWHGQSIEARFSAVETIRQATTGIYTYGALELPQRAGPRCPHRDGPARLADSLG